jgi:formylglycine-generating enzyme required for sulfatase activity
MPPEASPVERRQMSAALLAGIPPAWASEWGQDRFGLLVGFTVGEVTQRMRWIPQGRFLMGSPETEPGRYDNEGPRHEVVFRKGFWLFDTPCTQALWQEVMGGNPSRFQSPSRPVEQVKWNDAKTFVERVNARVAGLALRLPSEAEWEYACRAGSETALYSGPMKILGENNAPALDPIAWYGGNSGTEFELDDGYDASGWPEKQYKFSKAGTMPVKWKKPNAWGLYDMLGNVWEWCEDAWHQNYEGAPTDGGAREGEVGAARVLRGGSWDSYARDVRSAYRDRDFAGIANGLTGFRCARGQEPAEP